MLFSVSGFGESSNGIICSRKVAFFIGSIKVLNFFADFSETIGTFTTEFCSSSSTFSKFLFSTKTLLSNDLCIDIGFTDNYTINKKLSLHCSYLWVNKGSLMHPSSFNWDSDPVFSDSLVNLIHFFSVSFLILYPTYLPMHSKRIILQCKLTYKFFSINKSVISIVTSFSRIYIFEQLRNFINFENWWSISSSLRKEHDFLWIEQKLAQIKFVEKIRRRNFFDIQELLHFDLWVLSLRQGLEILFSLSFLHHFNLFVYVFGRSWRDEGILGVSFRNWLQAFNRAVSVTEYFQI